MEVLRKRENGWEWETEVCQALAPQIVKFIKVLSFDLKKEITEIRLRVGQPLLFVLGTTDIMMSPENKLTSSANEAYYCTLGDITRTFQLMCKNSIYAYEEELRSGYLTIAGGHRVGLAGQAIVAAGGLKALKNISSLNIRINKDVKGTADKLVRHLLDEDKTFQNTLIISPPRCGKTTLLRNIVRLISYGIPEIEFKGLQVGLVDERGEIAACSQGVPKADLGPRTDVLDACPKAVGLLMLIRSMAPAVVATDELGREEDAAAVREALHAGVKVLTTVHGKNPAEIERRPHIGELIRENFFSRYIVLSSRFGPGTLEEIFDSVNKKVLYKWNDGKTENENPSFFIKKEAKKFPL